MNWRSSDHPIWPILRTVVILLSMIIVLWMNAEDFDSAEIRSIITMFFALLGAEGITRAINK